MLTALFKPPVRVIVITDVIAIPVTIAVLAFLSPMNPISLFAYLLSAYALTISVIGFKRVIRRIRELMTGDEVKMIVRFRKLMHKNKLTALYLDSKDLRAEVSLYCGLAFNLLFATFKVTSGIHDGSAWLISIGFYYFAFAAARFMLTQDYRRQKSDDTNSVKLYEYLTYRRCGITNVIAFRKSNIAILLATKDLTMSGAVMSMFSLQNSMLHTFGGADDNKFRLIMNTVTGGSVLVIVLGIATFMIFRGTRKLKRCEDLQWMR
ncbi:hypothetical protein [Ruminococcus sp.]|uniref:hypothetical protein n=1 Tax=Ruminococcus sp. TaxID=41978 RepID=UPI0025DFFAA1|nr:hypothetical protein [Ruminococcus sp.]MBQ8967237.1 hypothetical protein [Ruminococcus sp.]